MGCQDLQRDDAIEPLIAGAVDLSHSAGAERRQNLVRTEAAASRDWLVFLHMPLWRRENTTRFAERLGYPHLRPD